ncbi:hypothetical protein AYI69_g7197 [Smittium culicis]|uniref:Uncharacterized protein n=1 Tax=Smittium culicis TaxID=133412 RepID=A0A1R1XTS5_9FUNG|nr:hypothetical protein AYI69_g7197 [Smittium culicis]
MKQKIKFILLNSVTELLSILPLLDSDPDAFSDLELNYSPFSETPSGNISLQDIRDSLRISEKLFYNQVCRNIYSAAKYQRKHQVLFGASIARASHVPAAQLYASRAGVRAVQELAAVQGNIPNFRTRGNHNREAPPHRQRDGFRAAKAQLIQFRPARRFAPCFENITSSSNSSCQPPAPLTPTPIPERGTLTSLLDGHAALEPADCSVDYSDLDVPERVYEAMSTKLATILQRSALSREERIKQKVAEREAAKVAATKTVPSDFEVINELKAVLMSKQRNKKKTRSDRSTN